MYSTHTYQCKREEQERIYKLYNKNFIVLQLNIEHTRNELCHYRGPLLRQSDVTGTRSRPHVVFRSPLVVTSPPRSVPTAYCVVTSLTGIPSVCVHHWSAWSAGHYSGPLQSR